MKKQASLTHTFSLAEQSRSRLHVFTCDLRRELKDCGNDGGPWNCT